MPRFRILPGGSFKLPDGTLKTTGDEIDLDSDVADSHSRVLEALKDEAPAPAPAAITFNHDAQE